MTTIKAAPTACLARALGRRPFQNLGRTPPPIDVGDAFADRIFECAKFSRLRLSHKALNGLFNGWTYGFSLARAPLKSQI